MTFPKFFKETLTLGLFLGFTTGSLTTSTYHLKQRQEERKVMLECQQAWEKYYSLNNNQTNQVIKPTDYNQTFWQTLINGTLSIIQAKTKELIINTNQPFTLEQQKYLVYHHEVLPKCQKLKDWKKEVSKLIKSKEN